MPSDLNEIPLRHRRDGDLPPAVAALIDEAGRRVDAFYEAGLGRRYPKYVPSDPLVVHAGLADLIAGGHLRGPVFCEWGCGFGVATGIAALLGLEAHGIEIEEALADHAETLLTDLGIPARILRTDYLPDGYEESDGVGGKDLISPAETTAPGGCVWAPEYDGLDPAEVDLFFVYPWPGQEQLMMDLFAAVATDGAILLMYLSEGEVVAYECEED